MKVGPLLRELLWKQIYFNETPIFYVPIERKLESRKTNKQKKRSLPVRMMAEKNSNSQKKGRLYNKK